MTDESHNYFPSGEWEGFYLYQAGADATRHAMHLRLTFAEGRVTGSGSDDVGPFTYRGQYDVTTFRVTMVKHYATHEVSYRGVADESGIYGSWELPISFRGGFHIWPKKQAGATQKRKTKKKVKNKKKTTVTSLSPGHQPILTA